MGFHCKEPFTEKIFNVTEPEAVDLSRNFQILTKIMEHLTTQTGTVLVLALYLDESKSFEDY